MNKDSDIEYGRENDKVLLFYHWVVTITIASVEKGIENTNFEKLCWAFIKKLACCITLINNNLDGYDTKVDAIIAESYKSLFANWRATSTPMDPRLEEVLRLMLEDFSKKYPNTKQVQEEMKLAGYFIQRWSCKNYR